MRNSCKGCGYRKNLSAYGKDDSVCMYMYYTEDSRGCSAENCDKWSAKIKNKRKFNENSL